VINIVGKNITLCIIISIMLMSSEGHNYPMVWGNYGPVQNKEFKGYFQTNFPECQYKYYNIIIIIDKVS